MGMKILAVRIGDRYGPEYEKYLENKLPEYDFIWIRKPIREDVLLQWNKMHGMSLDIDEPICVIDIDVLLVNNYKELFEFPIKKGQFVSIPGWWRDTEKKRYKINGGFFKYYPKDCRYIYDEFISKPDYWMEYYPKKGVTIAGMGEQNFIEELTKQKLNIKYLPDQWMTRWENIMSRQVLANLNMHYPADWLCLGEDLNQEVKLIHSLNEIPLNKKELEVIKNFKIFQD